MAPVNQNGFESRRRRRQAKRRVDTKALPQTIQSVMVRHCESTNTCVSWLDAPGGIGRDRHGFARSRNADDAHDRLRATGREQAHCDQVQSALASRLGRFGRGHPGASSMMTDWPCNADGDESVVGFGRYLVMQGHVGGGQPFNFRHSITATMAARPLSIRPTEL